MEMFHVRQPLVSARRHRSHRRVIRCRGEVHRRAPQSQNLRQSANVVAMLVGNYDAVEFFNGMAQSFQPAQSFFLAQPRVHQHARRRRFNQRQIAAAARRQNGYSNADRALPCRSEYSQKLVR